MNHYTQLRNLEEQIIRLDVVESILRVLGNSEANKNDLMNIIWELSDKVDDINKRVGEEFYDLFDQIRKESVPKNDMSVSDELMDIVNSWAR